MLEVRLRLWSFKKDNASKLAHKPTQKSLETQKHNFASLVAGFKQPIANEWWSNNDPHLPVHLASSISQFGCKNTDLMRPCFRVECTAGTFSAQNWNATQTLVAFGMLLAQIRNAIIKNVKDRLFTIGPLLAHNTFSVARTNPHEYKCNLI